MISLLVDIVLSIFPKLWFLTLESAAILKWLESLNGRKEQSKRIATKEWSGRGLNPDLQDERRMSYPIAHWAAPPRKFRDQNWILLNLGASQDTFMCI